MAEPVKKKPRNNRKHTPPRKHSAIQALGPDKYVQVFRLMFVNYFGEELWDEIIGRKFQFRDIDVPGLSTNANPIVCAIPWPIAYLLYLTQYPSEYMAYVSTGVSRGHVNTIGQHWPKFKEMCDVARELGRGNLEKWAFDLSRMRPGYFLMPTLLKAYLPHLYGEKKEVTVKGDQDNPVGMIIIPQQFDSEEEWNDKVEGLLDSDQ